MASSLIDGSIVECKGLAINASAEASGLRCRILPSNVDVPAHYDPERQAVICTAPKGTQAPSCCVYDAEGRLLGDSSGPKEGAISPSDSANNAAESSSGPESRFSALKPFVVISVSYLLYTMTDGAIRMIVLLYAYNLGFSAWDVAIMFTAYELAGVFTNLAAGMMGQKWKAILFVTFAQMLCGIAKDLTKLGGKTVTKLVTPDEKQSQLFRLVSLITGWKNSLKGVGYFIGAASVSYNFQFALGLLLILILLAMPWAIISLSNKLGRARSKNLSLFQIFQQKYNVNVLSVSRYFLFGSRDMWFEVPLPFFLRDSVQGLGWSRTLTGLFLALFIIIYGQVQSWTPQLILKPLKQSPANSLVALLWCTILIACPLFMGGMLQWSPYFLNRNLEGMQGVMIGGLSAFCLVFAVNSSVHSYLIVKYADGDKVALNIGFYYMANALGRLTGTLLSGALYSFLDPSSVVVGFAACFWLSAAFAAASSVVDCFLRDGSHGLHLGPCLTLVSPPRHAEPPLASQDDNGGPSFALQDEFAAQTQTGLQQKADESTTRDNSSDKTETHLPAVGVILSER